MLTPRDHELIEALVLMVRLFSQRQIAEHWWCGETANARRRLKALTKDGLLQPVTIAARTLPPIEEPVVVWQPGGPAPDFGKVAYRLQERWRRQAVRQIRAYTATDKAAQLFGGRGQEHLKHPMQATHDLGVAAVWLRLHERAPAWASAWRSEDLLASTRRGEKLPDAFVIGGGSEVLWVIEFGGSYTAARVQEFHEDCATRSLPYQIW